MCAHVNLWNCPTATTQVDNTHFMWLPVATTNSKNNNCRATTAATTRYHDARWQQPRPQPDYYITFKLFGYCCRCLLLFSILFLIVFTRVSTWICHSFDNCVTLTQFSGFLHNTYIHTYRHTFNWRLFYCIALISLLHSTCGRLIC